MAVVISGDGPITGVSSVKSTAANTAVVLGDSGSNTNTCRAWVNFNGTGTVAIRASFNVSSITDNGVGLYTANFATAMIDANYAVNVTANGAFIGASSDATTRITSATAFRTFDTNAIITDITAGQVAVFR